MSKVNDFRKRYGYLQAYGFTPAGMLVLLGGISSHRYLINSDTVLIDPDDPKKGRKPAPGSRVDLTIKALARLKPTAAEATAGKLRDAPEVNNGAFNRAGYGKASPDDFEHILSVAVSYGKLPGATTDLQKFADEYFGVDCTGFACAFWRTHAGMAALDAGCPYLYGVAKGASRVVWDANDIASGDALIWGEVKNGSFVELKKPGHISLVDEVVAVSDKTVVICCCESNGSAGDDPRETTRVLKVTPADSNGEHYWETDPGKERVVVIRPYIVTA
jgi:hypothetical protein